MALNQNSIVQEAIGADDVHVRALLNVGWRWDPPVSPTVINWFVDTTIWTPLQVQTITDMFATYAAVANVTFQQAANVADAEIVLEQTVGANIGGFGGYSGTPGEADGTPATVTFDDETIAQNGQVHTYLATDGFLIPGQPNTFVTNPGTTDVVISAEGFELMLHEVGHALGLKHPHDTGAHNSAVFFPGVDYTAPDPTATPPVAEQFFPNDLGNNSLNQSLYTLMSYNHWQDPASASGPNIPTMATPMAFDIAAIQRLYGANTTIRGGNDNYVLPDAGSDLAVECIWDTGGTDQIVYNGAANAHIDLRCATLDDSATGGGVLSYTFTVGASLARTFGYGFTIAGDYMGVLADVQGVTGVIIENAVGGSGDDEFVGNSVDNSWWGNAGDDESDGGGGTDTAVFSGARADYETSLVGGWVEIADLRSGTPDGTNSLLNFELFQFSNRTYTLDEVLNQPPEATSDSNGTAKKSTLVVSAAAGVLANDTDDNDQLAVSAVDGVAGNVGHVVRGDYGSLTLRADGSYSYVADKGGLPPKIVAQDVFSYTVSDELGNTDTATLSIVVFNPGVSYLSGANTSLYGGNGPDVVDGSAGNVVLRGGNGPDVLIGGDGDTLTGGNGPDTFLFRPGFGANVVTDFKVDVDALQFDKSIFASSTELLAHTLNTGAGAVIDDGDGNTVTLSGVTRAQMQAHTDDFFFV